MSGGSPFPLDVLLEPDETSLERLLTGWLGPAPLPAVITADGLPRALAEAIATVHRWPDSFRQTWLATIETIERRDGRLLIAVENQGNRTAVIEAIGANRDDPPVWTILANDERRQVDDSVSSWVLKRTIEELVIGSPGVRHLDTADSLAGLTRLEGIGPLDEPRGRAWVREWFYAGPEELAFATREPDPGSSWRARRSVSSVSPG